jgi:hypothetical protein
MSMLEMVDAPNRSDERTPRWSDRVVDFAFNAWAFLDNQNCAAVVRRMASGEYCLDENFEPIAVVVPLRTLQSWPAFYGWHERHDRFIQQTAGGLVTRTVGNMLQIAVNGSHALSQCVHQGVSPDKNLIEAVKLAIGVIGLSPIGSRDPSKAALSGGSARKHALQLHQLTDDELLDAERELAEPDEG